MAALHRFVSHEDEFFLAFAEAMVKLSELNSKWA